MPKVRQKQGWNSAVGTTFTANYNDGIAAGEATLQTAAINILDDFNGLRSQVNRIIGLTNWFDPMPDGGSFDLDTFVNNFMCGAQVLTDVVVLGGSTNWVVLSDVGLETPTVGGNTAPATSSATEGAVCATSALTGVPFAVNELTERGNTADGGALSPLNLVSVIDSTTRQVITTDNGNDVLALMQVESTFTGNGDSFNDSGNRVKLSFVRVNAAGEDLEAVPFADIAGKTINYNYPLIKLLGNVDPSCFTGKRGFVDQTASIDVTRQNAYANQAALAFTTGDTATMNIGSGLDWIIGDSAGAAAFTFDESVGASTIAISSAVDTFDVDADVNDFLNGASFDTGVAGTTINVGVTANTINTSGGLNIDATSAVAINSASGDILIGNDNVDGNITVGTGATAGRDLTFGNLIGTSSMAMRAASGGITLNTADAASPGGISLTVGNEPTAATDGVDIDLQPGDGGTTGAHGRLHLQGAYTETEAWFALTSSGTAQPIQMYSGTTSPNGVISADPGSLFHQDTGSGANLWLNTTSGGSAGTDWEALSTGSTENRQDVYDNQAGVVVTQGDYDATLDIGTGGRFWEIGDLNSATILRITESSATDSTQFLVNADDITLTADAPAAGGAGGAVTVTGGIGGTAPADAGGAVTVTSGAGGGVSGAGGVLSLSAGDAVGGGLGGNTFLASGTGVGTNAGGEIDVTAGDGGVGAGGTGGALDFNAGNAGVLSGASGGAVTITAGASDGVATGGAMTLSAGTGGNGGEGGSWIGEGGDALATSDDNGGFARLRGGAGDLSGGGGGVTINAGAAGLTGGGGVASVLAGDTGTGAVVNNGGNATVQGGSYIGSGTGLGGDVNLNVGTHRTAGVDDGAGSVKITGDNLNGETWAQFVGLNTAGKSQSIQMFSGIDDPNTDTVSADAGSLYMRDTEAGSGSPGTLWVNSSLSGTPGVIWEEVMTDATVTRQIGYTNQAATVVTQGDYDATLDIGTGGRFWEIGDSNSDTILRITESSSTDSNTFAVTADAINLTGLAPATTGTGGTVNVTGGAGGTGDATGGAVTIVAGAGGTTDGVGGDLDMDAGSGTGTGASGNINIGVNDAVEVNIISTGQATIDGGAVYIEGATLGTLGLGAVEIVTEASAGATPILIAPGNRVGEGLIGNDVDVRPGDGGGAGQRGRLHVYGAYDEDEELVSLDAGDGIFGNLEVVDIFVGAVSPDGVVSAPAGSSKYVDTGTTGEMWLNTSPGNVDGTQWEKVETAPAVSEAAGKCDQAKGVANVITASDATLTVGGTSPFLSSALDPKCIRLDLNGVVQEISDSAAEVLTFTGQPSAADTVTIGTTGGASNGIYTFVTAGGFADAAGEVVIGSSLAGTIENLRRAINGEAGGGTVYGAPTSTNTDAFATSTSTTLTAEAETGGTGGNAVAIAESGATMSWAAAAVFLSGGLDLDYSYNTGDGVVTWLASSGSAVDVDGSDRVQAWNLA